MNERVEKGDAFDPHDFDLDSSSIQVVVLPCELLKMSCYSRWVADFLWAIIDGIIQNWVLKGKGESQIGLNQNILNLGDF